MRYETYRALKNLFENVLNGNSRKYGHVVQNLLKKAFEKKGYMVESLQHEGIDLKINKGDKKFILEVKTSVKTTKINLSSHDINKIQHAEKMYDNYKTGIAVLILLETEEWIFGRLKRYRPGNIYPSFDLDTEDFSILKDEVEDVFEELVIEAERENFDSYI